MRTAISRNDSLTNLDYRMPMVAEKDTFAFFAFLFPKSDFRDSYRIFAFHIGFSHLISDFGVSYRIFAS